MGLRSSATSRDSSRSTRTGCTRRFLEYLSVDAPEDFTKIMRCYVERKGQYRRPTYTILWNLLYGGDPKVSLLPAAAQQLSEDYFLMHDDWMDNNSVRRGLPTVHRMYGAEYAIDAGDALQTIIWRIASDAKDSLGRKKGKDVLRQVPGHNAGNPRGPVPRPQAHQGVQGQSKFTVDDSSGPYMQRAPIIRSTVPCRWVP